MKKTRKNGCIMGPSIFLGLHVVSVRTLQKQLRVSPGIRGTTWFGSARLHLRAPLTLFEKVDVKAPCGLDVMIQCIITYDL